MLTKSIVFAALACSQALALPALQPRQASEASSAVASLTEAASSVVASATSVASDSASSVSDSASSAVESASSEASSASESVASASSSEAAPSASATPASYAEGLLAALRDRQAVALADLIEGNPEIAQAVTGLLGQESQNFTLIAPSDDALSEATQDLNTSDTAAVQNLLTYHVLPGYYPADYFEVNQTVILNTALNQNLVFYRDEYETTQIVGGQNATILGNSTYQNVLIKLSDGALQLPQNITATLADSEYGTSLVNTIASTAPDLVNTLDTAEMITVFAPSNQALSNIQDQLSQLAGDQQQIQQILLGHVVTGMTLYTNAGAGNLESEGATAQTAAGTTLSFIKNGTGLYVESQGTTAEITEGNIITSNGGMGMTGVIHVIDSVLVPAQAAAAPSASASESASSAAESASEVASSASESASGAVESATESASGAAASATDAAGGAASSAVEAASSAAAAVTSA